MKINSNHAYVMRVISTDGVVQLKIASNAPGQAHFHSSPSITMKGKQADIDNLQVDDVVICDLQREKGGRWIAYLRGKPEQIMIGRVVRKGARLEIETSEKNAKGRFVIDNPQIAENWDDGTFVEYKLTGTANREGAPIIRINKSIGQEGQDFRYSDLAIIEYGLRTEFTAAAVDEANNATVPSFENRVDLTSIPLVTIDGETARDFDDAVFAEPDTDPKNQGGWRAIVAIADVAHYVRPGSALDEEAQLRGNSVYFPDRVLPMLPEGLSNDMCSLRPNELRACVFVEMKINKDGHLIAQKFNRGIMKSQARLTYNQVQAYHDTKQDEMIKALPENTIENLYGVFRTLEKWRNKRGVLDIGSSERVIRINGSNIEDVQTYERFDSHKLIEELMIVANVASAVELENNKQPAVYRVHEQPNMTNVKRRMETLAELGFPLTYEGDFPTQTDFSAVIERAKDSPMIGAVRREIMQMQTAANYRTACIGHYGLNLGYYTHFTSPIRRYSDLIVHRAILNMLIGEQDDTLLPNVELLEEVASHISRTERTADKATRDTSDRIAADFLIKNPTKNFKATVVDVVANGFIAELNDVGMRVFVPIQACNDVYNRTFNYNRQKRSLFTHAVRDNARVDIHPGTKIMLSYHEADTLRGRMSCKPANQNAVLETPVKIAKPYTPL